MAYKRKTERAKKYRIRNCDRQCTLNPAHYSVNQYQLLHGWYEEGLSSRNMLARAIEAGIPVSRSSLERHKRYHLEVVDPSEVEIPRESEGSGRLSEIGILDKIIQSGGKALANPNMRVSPEMAMRAMELKYKLTQGSVMQEAFEAISKAMTGENPFAESSGDEQEQGLADSAPELRE